jgi:thiamine kinase-like enzyme
MDLKGHSGCKLSITPHGSIKKTSSSKEYNGRLIKQAQKQQNFISDNEITAPKVLLVSSDQELSFFEMEFIQGDTFAKLIMKEEFSVVKAYFSRILSFVSDSITIENSIDITSAVYEKVLSIDINADVEIKSFIRSVESENLYAPSGYCHGDLTFENIMIDKRIYFLDFLDSFIDTPLIDLAKISQEFNVSWSYRNSKDIDRLIVSKMRALNNIFSSFVKTLPNEYRKTFRYLEILNLIRILPYTKDINTYMLLKKSISNLNKFL